MNEIDSVDIFNFKHINCRMPYLDAVVMEINRLYPVVHATLRIMHRETTLTSGKQPAVLKPDMLVYLSFLHLQTSKKFWGPNADKFVPERFIGGHNKEHPLLAFGYCPRNCVRHSSSDDGEQKLTYLGWLQVRHSCIKGIPRDFPPKIQV